MEIKGIKIYNSQISRFKSLDLAKSFANRCKYIVRPVQGDDGKYWVLDNTRLESLLIKNGYEYA